MTLGISGHPWAPLSILGIPGHPQASLGISLLALDYSLFLLLHDVFTSVSPPALSSIFIRTPVTLDQWHILRESDLNSGNYKDPVSK